MRFLEHLKRRWLEKNARFWGKECGRVMLFAFAVKKNQYESTAPNLAWLIRQTTLTRTDWQQVGDETLLHVPSGRSVEISGDTNLRSAIHFVIELEYGYEIGKLVNPWECDDMLREAHAAADQYLDQKIAK